MNLLAAERRGINPSFSPAFAETKTRLCEGRSAEAEREGGLELIIQCFLPANGSCFGLMKIKNNYFVLSLFQPRSRTV